MQCSKLSIWKRYQWPIEGIRKGHPFWHKWYIKRQRVGPRGRNLPLQNFVEYPPGVYLLIIVILRLYIQGDRDYSLGEGVCCFKGPRPSEATCSFSWCILGQAVYDQSGELVCTKPFPCMPVYFWNDPQGLKYKKAYFNKFAGELLS